MSDALEAIRAAGAYLPVRLGLEQTPAQAPTLCLRCPHRIHAPLRCEQWVRLHVEGAPSTRCLCVLGPLEDDDDV